MLSINICEQHIKEDKPYTGFNAPYPLGDATLPEDYRWCWIPWKGLCISRKRTHDIKTITVFYDDTAGWSIEDGGDMPHTVEVDITKTDCWVAGILCGLTGVTKYAQYCIDNPDDNQPITDYGEF